MQTFAPISTSRLRGERVNADLRALDGIPVSKLPRDFLPPLAGRQPWDVGIRGYGRSSFGRSPGVALHLRRSACISLGAAARRDRHATDPNTSTTDCDQPQLARNWGERVRRRVSTHRRRHSAHGLGVSRSQTRTRGNRYYVLFTPRAYCPLHVVSRARRAGRDDVRSAQLSAP